MQKEYGQKEKKMKRKLKGSDLFIAEIFSLGASRPWKESGLAPG